MRILLLILFFLIASCQARPIFKIPNKVTIEKSYFCEILNSQYVVKIYQFRDFNNLDFNNFTKYLDCPGGSGNEISYLDLTEIDKLENEDLIILKPVLNSKIVCVSDSILSINYDDLFVSGCKSQFSKSINNQYTDFTAIYLVDKKNILFMN